jgi:hypothetical protein
MIQKISSWPFKCTVHTGNFHEMGTFSTFIIIINFKILDDLHVKGFKSSSGSESKPRVPDPCKSVSDSGKVWLRVRSKVRGVHNLTLVFTVEASAG